MAKAQPNLGWLGAVQEQLDDDHRWRRLGSTDVAVALAIGDVCKLVEFEAFGINAIKDIAPHQLRDADLVLRMSPKDWNAYLRKRAKGTGQSLLSLDLDTPGGLISAANPLQRLLFERYNLSLQAFIDAGAALAHPQPA